MMLVWGNSSAYPFKERLEIEIYAYPPDKRKRDLDNLLKVTMDSLQSAGFYLDDGQVDKITITRQSVVPNGELHILLSEIEHE